MRTIILAICATATLGACGPAYYVATDDDPLVTTTPPPEDEVETTGVAPTPDATWVRGYWYWTGARWVWIAGHWSRPPEVGFVWAPSGWVFIEGVYRFIPGRWAHHRHVPRYRWYRPRDARPPRHEPTPHPRPHAHD